MSNEKLSLETVDPYDFELPQMGRSLCSELLAAAIPLLGGMSKEEFRESAQEFLESATVHTDQLSEDAKNSVTPEDFNLFNLPLNEEAVLSRLERVGVSTESSSAFSKSMIDNPELSERKLGLLAVSMIVMLKISEDELLDSEGFVDYQNIASQLDNLLFFIHHLLMMVNTLTPGLEYFHYKLGLSKGGRKGGRMADPKRQALKEAVLELADKQKTDDGQISAAQAARNAFDHFTETDSRRKTWLEIGNGEQLYVDYVGTFAKWIATHWNSLQQ